MRNEDIADLESSLHQAESELSVLIAKSKHVNRMADCVDAAIASLELCTSPHATFAAKKLREALNHFAEWEK